jgi:DNA repair protein RadC
MSIHDGHRQRMKRRFLEHGLDNFDDVNALELLLFFAEPRRDTNEHAHALMAKFGSLSGVLEARPEELRSVPGIGDNAAALLSLIPAMSRRYLVEKTPDSEPVADPASAGRYFIPHFMYETEEVVLVLLLDARKRPILCRELSRGVVNAAEINARKLAELCLERRASAVILAHNHLSGVALPSAEDETATAQLRRALELIGVELSDHIVVAGCEYVSMRESGLLR